MTVAGAFMPRDTAPAKRKTHGSVAGMPGVETPGYRQSSLRDAAVFHGVSVQS